VNGRLILVIRAPPTIITLVTPRSLSFIRAQSAAFVTPIAWRSPANQPRNCQNIIPHYRLSGQIYFGRPKFLQLLAQSCSLRNYFYQIPSTPVTLVATGLHFSNSLGIKRGTATPDTPLTLRTSLASPPIGVSAQSVLDPVRSGQSSVPPESDQQLRISPPTPYFRFHQRCISSRRRSIST
jgi:hypothetical protein